MRPDDHDKYHPDMFLDENSQDEMDAMYTEYTKAAFDYYSRSESQDDSSGSCIALQDQMNETAWKLFVGLNAIEVQTQLKRDDISVIYHHDVTRLLDYFRRFSRATDFKALRAQYRAEFLEGRKSRPFEFDGVIWLVGDERDLPWMIPIRDFSFHNSAAVYWKVATLYEMIICGRLVGANERLYEFSSLYKRLFPLVVYMNKHLVHKPDEPDKWEHTVWDNWHSGQSFFWYRPCFRVCVIPSLRVRYCMVLAFDKSVTRDERGNPRDLVVVPAFSHVYTFAGEVRPVDLATSDEYGFNYLANRGMKGLSTVSMGSKRRTDKPDLVCTNYVLYDNRPGVGSAAYMANHTCGMGETGEAVKDPKARRPNEYFYFPEIRVGNREGNAIAKADALVVFTSIKSSRDITAEVVVDWMDKNAENMSTWFGEMTQTYDLFPVEFVYNRTIPESASKGSACRCMTRCSRAGVTPSNIMIDNVRSITERAQRESYDVLVAEINASMSDRSKHTTKIGYIRDYLMRWFGDSLNGFIAV
jgi:hypothetical protein